MDNTAQLQTVFPQHVVRRPLLIAGPCSAESEEQVLVTARALSAQGVQILRAGVWKPRTRPGSFEGHGTEALAWLKRAKQETGMLLATEVATVKHIFEAIKAGVDILWIGARTTVNTFAMQELAEGLRGVDLPVLIKNPVSPDLELWAGAVERLQKVGVSKIAAIHRGFSRYECSTYRNAPEWQIPIEFRLRLPHIPMICDPSHIAGKRQYLQEVAQRALDLNYDGLMIEVHPSPDQALSDAAQQLTPEDFRQLVASLVLRHEEEPDSSFQRRLQAFRNDIDLLDEELVTVLERRMRIVEGIGLLKKEKGVTILQSGRWEQILARMVTLGARHGIGADCIEQIYKAIHEESMNRQNAIMNRSSQD
jgi:chorismate mutase